MSGRPRFERVVGVQTLFWQRRWRGEVSGHALRPDGSFRARGSRPRSRKARKETPNTAWASFRPSSKGNLAVAFRLGGSQVEPTAIRFGSQGSRRGGRHLTRKRSAARLKMSIRKEETRRTRSLAFFLPAPSLLISFPRRSSLRPERSGGRPRTAGRPRAGQPRTTRRARAIRDGRGCRRVPARRSPR